MKPARTFSAALVAVASTFAVTAFAQSFTPVPAVPKSEAVEATPFERVITLSPDQRWINVYENERVKLVSGTDEKLVDFGLQGVEKLEVGGKSLTVYVGMHPQHTSPGE
jgi:hypothetical protein